MTDLPPDDQDWSTRQWVRRRLLEVVPSRDEATTVAVLACRADMAHHRVRENLEALFAQGTVDRLEGPGGKHLYYRKGDDMKEPTLTTAERVVTSLPTKKEHAGTVAEIAAHLGLGNARVQSALIPYRDRGEVIRIGRGGRNDPFRYYAPDAAENEAPTSTETPDLPDTDTPAPQESDPLPAGYTDAPEVLAAKLEAERKDPDDATDDADEWMLCPLCRTQFNRAAYNLDGGGERCPSCNRRVDWQTVSDDATDDAELAHCYAVVAANLDGLAVEALRDAEVLTAAVELLSRILEERLKP